MRKKAILLMVVLFIVCSAVKLRAEELHIGYIDMQKVFTEYKKTKKAEDNLEVKGKDMTKEREKMVEAIRRLKDEIELLNDKSKETKQEEMDEKIRELQEFDRQTRRDMMREREDIVRDIAKDIDSVIEEYGAKHEYDFIFNSDKRVMLFKKEGLDLTGDIVRMLNK